MEKTEPLGRALLKYRLCIAALLLSLSGNADDTNPRSGTSLEKKPPEHSLEETLDGRSSPTSPPILIIPAPDRPYLLPYEPVTQEARAAFLAMPEEARIRFYENRSLFLKSLVHVLEWGKVALGAGDHLKDRVWDPTWERIRRFFSGKPVECPLRGGCTTIRERGHDVIQKLVELADSQLWQNPSLIAETDEVGMVLEVGVVAGIAVDKYGAYGTGGFGIVLGVNKLTGSITVEAFLDLEMLKRAIPFTGGAGVYALLAGNLSHRDRARAIGFESGHGLTGPGPLVASITQRNLRIGFARGFGVSIPVVSEIPAVHTRLVRVRAYSAIPAALQTLVALPYTAAKNAVKSCAAFLEANTPQPTDDVRWSGY